jgi:hypothetical protein
VGPAEVLQVDGASALRKLRQAPDAYRLVLARDAKLYTDAAWALRLSAGASRTAPRPAIFTTAAPDHADNPATTLTLYPHPDEVARLDAMLDAVSNKDPQPLLPQQPPPGVIETALHVFIRTIDPALSGPRDRDIVWALWLGALGLQAHGFEPAEWVTAAHAAVCRALRGKTARPADVDFNPLAVAMVGRANAYLSIASAGAGSCEPGDAGGDPAQILRPDIAAGITRRELVDLGHPGGALVRAMVARLRVAERLNDYLRLGLTCATLPKGWPGEGTDALCGLLLPWTEKQVRTVFTRLVRAGDIEGTRATRNDHWTYRLPETLGAARRTFDALPEPAVVAAVAAAVAGNVPRAADPPSPPLAPAPGQTESLAG